MWAFLFPSLWGSMFVFIGTNERQNDQCNVSVDAVEAKNYSILGLGFASFHNHAEVLKGCWPLGTWSRVFFCEDRRKEDWNFCSKKLRFTDVYIIITSYSFFVYPCLSCRSCNSLHLTENCDPKSQAWFLWHFPGSQYRFCMGTASRTWTKISWTFLDLEAKGESKFTCRHATIHQLQNSRASFLMNIQIHSNS